MSPLQHIIITIIAFFLLSLAVPMPLSVLFWSLALTLGVDIFDHVRLFFVVRNQTYGHSRELIRAGKLFEAYRYYCKNRITSNYTLLHNVWAMALVWAVTVWLASPILLLGLVLHFACDQTYLIAIGRLGLWFRRGEYSDIAPKSKKGRWAAN